MIDLSISFLRGYYSHKKCNLLFFFLMGKRTVLEGEHAYPNGTISLTLVSIFIPKKNEKKKVSIKTQYYLLQMEENFYFMLPITICCDSCSTYIHQGT